MFLGSAKLRCAIPASLLLLKPLVVSATIPDARPLITSVTFSSIHNPYTLIHENTAGLAN